MRPQRRRAGNDSNAASCPMCGKVFPSVKNQDPMDYENMVVKHITKCSALVAATKTPYPGSKQSERSTSWSESLEGKTPATVTPTDSPITGSSLTRMPSSVLGPDDEMEYCSLVEQIAQRDRSKVYRDEDEDKKLPAKVIDETVMVNPNSDADSFASTVTNHDPLKTTKMSSKMASRRAHVAKVAKKPPALSTMHCPACNKSFPQLKHKFSHTDYERRVLKHVIACTKPLASIPYKIPVAVKSSPWKIPENIGLKTKSQQRKPTGADNDASSTKSNVTPNNYGYDSKSLSSSSGTTASAQQPSPPKKCRVIVDPGHFLAQTWWRKQKVKRRSVPIPTFNLQQCLVEDYDHEDKLPRAREGSRRKQNNSKGPTLKLRCPICKRNFGADMLGEITEETMSRHVTKCTQKMFDTGIDLSIYSQHSSSRKGTAALFSKSVSAKANTMVAHVRRVLTEEERKGRSLALKERRKDLRTVMKGKGKRALDDMFLEHCNSM